MPVSIGKGAVTRITVRKVQAQLQEKAAVSYVYAPDTSVLCQECAFITPGGKCTDHPGKEQFVSLETGSCNDWQDLRQGRVRGNNSRAWVVVAYTENQNGFGCRRCRHMGYPKHDCDAVDRNSPGATPGEIHPYGCCNLWKKDTRRGNWPEAKFK